MDISILAVNFFFKVTSWKLEAGTVTNLIVPLLHFVRWGTQI